MGPSANNLALQLGLDGQSSQIDRRSLSGASQSPARRTDHCGLGTQHTLAARRDRGAAGAVRAKMEGAGIAVDYQALARRHVVVRVQELTVI
jgi:hypothetical protein